MESTVRASGGQRPGGRTADVTLRIHEAVRRLLLESGTDACSYKNVAERAGVERSTLYRRYPDRWDMLIDAFIDLAGTEVVPDLGHSFASDLKSVLSKLAAMLNTPLGPAVMSVAGELQAQSRNEVARTFFDRRMSQLEPMFDAAVARGELSAEVDGEEVFTFAAGAIYFRTFIAARGVDDAFIDRVVENVCWMFCAGSPASRGAA